MFSARPKLRYFNEGCDICIVKEWSVSVRVGEHVPFLTRYVGEELYIDLVSISDNARGNCYLLTAEDSCVCFSMYVSEYIYSVNISVNIFINSFIMLYYPYNKKIVIV